MSSNYGAASLCLLVVFLYLQVYSFEARLLRVARQAVVSVDPDDNATSTPNTTTIQTCLQKAR